MADHSIEARFEGYEITEHGIAQVPNLLFKHYCNLGLSDGHFTLIAHIIARKWSKEPPFPSLTHIPMSGNVDTRRRYVRDLRRMGLIFTKRLYWRTSDSEKYPQANPGRVRSNLWYLGSILYNLERMENWLAAGYPISEFYIVIPQQTVAMFLDGTLNDTPEEIGEAIKEQTEGGEFTIPVHLGGQNLVCEKHIVDGYLVCEKRIVDDSNNHLVCEKLVLEKRIVMNKNHDSNKNQQINNNKKDKDSNNLSDNDSAEGETTNEHHNGLAINYDCDPIPHCGLKGKWVYYRSDPKDEKSPLLEAVVLRTTAKRVDIALKDGGEVKKTINPEKRLFYQNGHPDLIPVCIGKPDPEQEGAKLTPNQLALKNQLIDMINYADLGESEGAKIRRMSEIQKAALQLDAKGNTVEDLKDYQRWYVSNDWRGKKGNPIKIAVMRETWNAEFKPWQVEQKAPKIKTSVSEISGTDSEIEIVPSFMQQKSDEPQSPQDKALSEFLERIKLAMTPRSFDDLFADASAKSLEGDVLTVLVPEERQRLVIENRYPKVVKRTLAQMGAEFEISFEVGGDRG